ncbi:MAG: CoB--CoM heterodisulfide reductase iron-sulfur subunit B family protein [Chloroflexi bacterium]|nr:CoB--CoM heterodisulfide reductase iron-sulfur subunit B family protein [Chloroflexota bacterium]
MKLIFYPGCSMLGPARPYMESLTAIEPLLEMELQEVEDWNCCGATEYMAVHRLPAYALVARNLAIAQKQSNGSRTVMAACSACYLNLAKTDKYMADSIEMNVSVNDALAAGGLSYDPGSLRIRHLLDVLYTDIGLEKIRARVTRPLNGLKIAPYYGCMIVRPDPHHRWPNPENPTALEEILEALGAEAVEYPMKTRCCSGHMTLINPDTAYELIRELVHSATISQADLLATLCPMCQLNLDAYQVEMNKHFGSAYHMPVLYITQLIGLAFGLAPEQLGIGKEFIPSAPALAKIGVEIPPEAATPRRGRKKDEGLPMPQMPTRKGGPR